MTYEVRLTKSERDALQGFVRSLGALSDDRLLDLLIQYGMEMQRNDNYDYVLAKLRAVKDEAMSRMGNKEVER